MGSIKLAMGSDHAGYSLRQLLKSELETKGFTITDYGCPSEESVDYPDFAHPVADAVETGAVDLGILLCGSGNGINMTANKHQGVRSALCWTEEIAELARLHNDANVLTLPARFIDEATASKIVDRFLNTAFEGGRHGRRVEKISVSETSN